MSKTRTVRRYTDEAVQRAAQFSHDDYKRIKHMNKVELVAYIDRVYFRGYQNGYNAAVEAAENQIPAEVENKDESSRTTDADE